MDKDKLKKAYEDFKPYDYGYNFRLFVESLRLTKEYLKTAQIEDYGSNLNALEKAIELGDKIINGKCEDYKEETMSYNEFWDIMKNNFTLWWY